MRLPILFLLSFMSTLGLAQGRTVTGWVVDAESHEPLVSATIHLRKDSSGAVTDLAGRFTLATDEERPRAVVTYAGYEPRDVTLNTGRADTIFLSPATVTLDEVVVIGYGAVRMREATPTAASEIKTSDLTASSPRSERAAEPTSTSWPVADRPGLPQAGQLTATEINDFGKWDLWSDVSRAELDRYRSRWPVFPDHRYAVQLTHANGQPVTDRTVHLETAAGDRQWTARTDNHGRAELWYRPWAATDEVPQALRLRVEGNRPGAPGSVHPVRPFSAGLTLLSLPEPCTRAHATADVAFVVDATGSMQDELRFLAAELTDVMRRARRELTDTDLRLGAVYYRDRGEEYLTRHQDFAADTTVTGFVGRQRAAGGGDAPEAVTDALATALDSLSWRAGASRLLFLVLDAPPHNDAADRQRLQTLTARAAVAGVRIVPVICSGMSPDGEYLFRSLALATNGTAVFLTDDSGIGNPHLEPVTDETEVEALNDLLVRLIVERTAVVPCGSQPVAEVPTQQGKPGEEDWRVYPNPTAGPVTLRLPRGRGTLQLLDAGGKLLDQRELTRRRAAYDLGQWPAGNYLLRYRTEKTVSARWVTLVRAR